MNRIEAIHLHRLVLTDQLVDAFAQTIARATNLKSFSALRMRLHWFGKRFLTFSFFFFCFRSNPQIFSKVLQCVLVSIVFAS